MTIEKLLGMSAKEWEALSDADLHKFLEPYLKVTRPVLKSRQEKAESKAKVAGGGNVRFNASSIQEMMKQAAAILAKQQTK